MVDDTRRDDNDVEALTRGRAATSRVLGVREQILVEQADALVAAGVTSIAPPQARAVS